MVKPDIPLTYFAPKDEDGELTYRKNLAALLSNYPESPLTPGLPPGFGPNMNSPFAQYQKFNNASMEMNMQRLQNMQISPNSMNRFQAQLHQQNSNKFLAPPMTAMPQTRQNVSPRTNTSANTSGYHSFSGSTNSLEQLYAPYQQNIQAGMSQFSPEQQNFMSASLNRRLSESNGSQTFENEGRSPTSYGSPVKLKKPNIFTLLKY